MSVFNPATTNTMLRWHELSGLADSVKETVEDMAVRFGGTAKPADAQTLAAQLADLFRQMAAECDELAHAS